MAASGAVTCNSRTRVAARRWLRLGRDRVQTAPTNSKPDAQSRSTVPSAARSPARHCRGGHDRLGIGGWPGGRIADWQHFNIRLGDVSMEKAAARDNGSSIAAANTAANASAGKGRRRIASLRDFIDLLVENRQCITWPDPINPEPDIRNIAVASGNDVQGGPAVMFDRNRGYPGKRVITGVHGSWANIALLLGHPKDTSIKDLFYDMASRWGARGAKPELIWVKPEDAAVNE